LSFSTPGYCLRYQVTATVSSDPTPQSDGGKAVHLGQPARAPAVGRGCQAAEKHGRRRIRRDFISLRICGFGGADGTQRVQCARDIAQRRHWTLGLRGAGGFPASHIRRQSVGRPAPERRGHCLGRPDAMAAGPLGILDRQTPPSPRPRLAPGKEFPATRTAGSAARV